MRPAALALLLSSCATSPTEPVTPDAAPEPPRVEVICPEYSCGELVTQEGGTVDCGSCPSGSECGDNGFAHTCGSTCVARPDLDACRYALGYEWGAGTVVTELSGECNYANPETCLFVDVPWPADGICSADVCSTWWCCAGTPALVPGAAGDAGT